MRRCENFVHSFGGISPIMPNSVAVPSDPNLGALSRAYATATTLNTTTTKAPAGGRCPPAHAARDHFSTPVMTTPCMKKRWAMKKITTGRISAMSEPAWIRCGCWP